MTMTAAQIVRAATARVREASTHVRIKNIKPSFLKNGYPKIVAETLSIADADGNPKQRRESYKCVVYGTTKLARLREGPVKVSCSCPYFTYNSEYALWKRGAADIVHSNGEPPVEKNPTLRPTPCKHLLLLLEKMIEARV